MKFFRLAAVRGGGQKNQLLIRFFGNAAEQVIALLLTGRRAGGPGTGVRFIDDDQFRTLFDEDIAPDIGLDEVDADDLVGIVVVDAGIALNLPVQARLGVGADDDRFQVELGANLRLPLFAQVRQADNGKALDLAPLQQFLDDQQRFNGFAHTDVVGDQQAHRLPDAGP